MELTAVEVKDSQSSNKKQFYFEYIKECQKANLSKDQYCKQHGIKLTTFGYWRKKYREVNNQNNVKAHGFTQIKIKESIQPKVEIIKELPRDPIAVALPNGIELKLTFGMENQHIYQSPLKLRALEISISL